MLLVAEMLRLGKLITKTTDVIDIHHFNMMEMAWSGTSKASLLGLRGFGKHPKLLVAENSNGPHGL